MNQGTRRFWSMMIVGAMLIAGVSRGDDSINFSGDAKASGDIKVKIKLVNKSDGQPAGECEVTVGIVVGESSEDKANKVTNALNNATLPCAALVSATRTSSTSTITPDNANSEIQTIEVTDTLDKAKVTVNGHVVAAATGRVHIDGVAGEVPEQALCSVTLANGFSTEVAAPMANMQGDQLEQILAHMLLSRGVPATWDGDLRVDFGSVDDPTQEVSIGLDVSTLGRGFGPGTFVGIETTPNAPSSVGGSGGGSVATWGKIKSMYR